MTVTPILNNPLFLWEHYKGPGDSGFHLGIEWTYPRVLDSSRVEKRKKRICEYIENVKQTYRASWWHKKCSKDIMAGKKKSRTFLKHSSFCACWYRCGNHDGDIEELITSTVNVHAMRVCGLMDRLFPRPILAWCWIIISKALVMSITIPPWGSPDSLGHAVSEEVWIRTRFIEKMIIEHYGKIKWMDPEVIIMLR